MSAFYVSGAMLWAQDTARSYNSCPRVTHMERVEEEEGKEANNHSYCPGATVEIWMDCSGNAEEGHCIHSGMGVVEFHLPEKVVLQLNEHEFASRYP